MLVGATPASQVVVDAEDLIRRAATSPYSRSDALRVLSIAQAMLEQPAESRRTVSESIRLCEDLRRTIDVAITLSDASWIERLNGDLPRAEGHVRNALQILDGVDHTQFTFVRSRLIVVLVAQQKYEEALDVIDQVGDVPQASARVRITGAKARIHAACGEGDLARAEVADILQATATSGFVNVRTDVLVDAAEAMAALGDIDTANDYYVQAIALSDTKQNKALAAQLRRRLTELPELG